MDGESSQQRGWRWAPCYTALSGLLDGITRLVWVRAGGAEGGAADEGWWEGLVGAETEMRGLVRDQRGETVRRA